MPEFNVTKVKAGTAVVWPTKQKPIAPRSRRDRSAANKMLLKKLPPTTAEQWRKVISTIPRDLFRKLEKAEFWTLGAEIVLSARTPVTEGHGYIEGAEIQSYVPSHPALYFIEKQGVLDIWLINLDTSATYMMELRLAAHGGSVLLGASDSPNVEMPAQGADHRAYVYISDLTYDMSLVSVRGDNASFCGFYEARVWRLT